MPVARVEQEAVLEHEGRDPHVVGGNGRSLSSKLQVDPGMMVGRLLVGKENPYSRSVQETSEDAFVLAGQAAACEPCPKLRERHKWHADRAGHKIGV